MESNINHIATTYAFVAAVYNSSKSFFEQFVPLLEYYFVDQRPNHSRLTISSINEGINSTFGLAMPKATLMKLLHIMKKQHKVEIKDNSVYINKDTLDLDYIKKKQEIEDDLDELYSEFLAYLKIRGIIKGKEEVKESLMTVVYNNVAAISDFFGHTKKIENLEKDIEKQVENFFNEVVYKNDKLKRIVASLLFGAQKTYLLNLKPSESEEFLSNDFVDEVILDTNFVLRLLNLQDGLNCTVAQETFSFLKSRGVAFKVLSITIQEINSSISSYLQESSNLYQPTLRILAQNRIRLSGFTAALGGGLIHKADLLKLTQYMTLEKKLMDLGIEVVFRGSYPYNESHISSLVSKKARDTYTRDSAEHDLKLIKYCEDLRKKRNPRDANKIWVLTCDSKLAAWNREIKAGNHVCISEGQLSSIMWVNCYENELQINRVIAALSDNQSMSLKDIVQFQRKVADYIEEMHPTRSELYNFLSALIEEDDYIVDSCYNPRTSASVDALAALSDLISDTIDDAEGRADKNVNIERIADEIKEQEAAQKRKQDEIKCIQQKLKVVTRTIILVSIITVVEIAVILGLSFTIGYIAWRFGDFDVLGWVFSLIVPMICFIITLVYPIAFGKEFNVHQLTFDIAQKVCKDNEMIKAILSTSCKGNSLINEYKDLIEKQKKLCCDLLKIEGGIESLKKAQEKYFGKEDIGS